MLTLPFYILFTFFFLSFTLFVYPFSRWFVYFFPILPTLSKFNLLLSIPLLILQPLAHSLSPLASIFFFCILSCIYFHSLSSLPFSNSLRTPRFKRNFPLLLNMIWSVLPIFLLWAIPCRILPEECDQLSVCALGNRWATPVLVTASSLWLHCLYCSRNTSMAIVGGQALLFVFPQLMRTLSIDCFTFSSLCVCTKSNFGPSCSNSHWFSNYILS